MEVVNVLPFSVHIYLFFFIHLFILNEWLLMILVGP